MEMIENTESPYGKSNEYSTDKHGNEVRIGYEIRVLEIDERILVSLPEDEIEELKSFIGEVFSVVHINTDNSVLVEKEWGSGDEVMGHGLAVFPGQFEIEKNGS